MKKINNFCFCRSRKSPKKLLKMRTFLLLSALFTGLFYHAQSYPGGVSSSLQLWLPAENYTGAGTWNDASGNGRNATKTGTVGTTGLYNFNNVPTGLTNANYFSIAHNTALDTNDGAIAVFAVGLPANVTSTTYSPFVAKTNNSNWDAGWILTTSSPSTDVGFTTGDWVGTGSGNVAKQSNFSSTAPYIVSGFGNGATTNVVSISNNGNVETTNTSTKTASATALTIGWDRYSANQGFKGGNIAEVIMYNRNLSAAEKLQVQSYLALKYGISLSQATAQSYIASNGTTKMWDHTKTEASTYNKNIFGIGRDNGSNLNQKQSKSMGDGQQLIIGLGPLRDTNAANTGTITNNQFLVVGDNGLSQSLTTSLLKPDAPGGKVNNRFASIWKVQNSGIGTVTVAWPVGITNLHLVRSTNNTFDSSDEFISMSGTATINNETYNTAQVTFNEGDYFTLAGLVTGPGGVGNVSLWYEPTTSVTQTSGLMTAWGNKGSYANTTLTASGAARPTLSAANAASNFNPYVTFAASTGMRTPNGSIPTGLSNHTTFLAVSNLLDSSTNAANIIYFSNNGSDSFHDFGMGLTSSTAYTLHYWDTGGGERRRTNTFPVVSSYTNILGARIRSASPRKDVSVMGYNESFADNGTNYTIDNTLSMGDLGLYGNRGLVREFVMFGEELSDVDRQKVDSYLAVKWGMTLRQPKNYISSSQSIVWESSLNTSYNNNIFGIARDDASALHQKVSNSIIPGTILTVASSNDFTSNNQAAGRTSLASDISYLMFGDNNNTSAVPYTPTSIGSCGEVIDNGGVEIKLIPRQWLVQRTSQVGTTYIQVDLSAYAGGINSNIFMLVADDSGLTQNITKISGTNIGGGKYVFSHNFDNEAVTRYITFGGEFVATPCEQCKGGTFTLRTGYQWNQGLYTNQQQNKKENILLGNDSDGNPIYASMYADYTENPSIEYSPNTYPRRYSGKWAISRRYDNTTAKAYHKIVLTKPMKAQFQISNINTYQNNKNNFEVIGYCNGTPVLPKITFASTRPSTFEISGNKVIGTKSWRGFIPTVSTANVRFDRPVTEIRIICSVDRVNTRKTLRSVLYGDMTLSCAEQLPPNADNVSVSHTFTQDNLSTCGGETTMRIKLTNNNICSSKTVDLTQTLPSGLQYVPNSFNGNDMPAGSLAGAIINIAGGNLSITGIDLPQGEHYMYVDVANPGTAGTYPTQFSYIVTNGANQTYQSPAVNLTYTAATPLPVKPELTQTIKEVTSGAISCGVNNMQVTYRMKIKNVNATPITGAEILQLFDYDQTIASYTYVTGEDSNGIVSGTFPTDGSGNTINPVGASLFLLENATIPVGVSYIDIVVNLNNSYNITEVQQLGISSGFSVNIDSSGECSSNSAEAISNEAILPWCLALPDLTPTIDIEDNNFLPGASRNFIVKVFVNGNVAPSIGVPITVRIPRNMNGFNVTVPGLGLSNIAQLGINGVSSVIGSVANNNGSWLFRQTPAFIIATSVSGLNLPVGGSSTLGFNIERINGTPPGIVAGLTAIVDLFSTGEADANNNAVEININTTNQ